LIPKSPPCAASSRAALGFLFRLLLILPKQTAKNPLGKHTIKHNRRGEYSARTFSKRAPGTSIQGCPWRFHAAVVELPQRPLLGLLVDNRNSTGLGDQVQNGIQIYMCEQETANVAMLPGHSYASNKRRIRIRTHNVQDCIY
jgi:hypothetical protein